jgi:hypothetical protein
MKREPIAPRQLCNPQCIANQQEKRQQAILRRITDEKLEANGVDPDQKAECSQCHQAAQMRCVDCSGCEHCCHCD